MSNDETTPEGPDFAAGVPLSAIADGGALAGHVQGDPVLVVRRGSSLFAVGAFCTHYGGPLADGLVVDDTVRCPWHHACFSLRTGQALRAPALDPIPAWRVDRQNDMVYVRDRLVAEKPGTPPVAAGMPGSIVIVGGGAAGNAAAETLRNEGYTGRITMLSADVFAPYDRPNLSKDYLAGSAPEEFIPLRSAGFYQDHDIDLRLNARVVSIDTGRRSVQLEDGDQYAYDALLLATGADPVRLDVPGADLPHVHYLRSLADCRALIAKAKTSQRAVIVGAGFIGLEVAASLRARNITVEVVAPGSVPMEHVLGSQAGQFVRELHERHEVVFHLGATVVSIGEQEVVLDNGEILPADMVVVGIGVRPAIALAQQAGLAMDRGVLVDEYLQTSVKGVYAAGDIARWPYGAARVPIRVEHWVVAERQGQTAARNLLGKKERFDAVPFFWTNQYDLSLGYIGHAEKWDQIDIDGKLDSMDCLLTYRHQGKDVAAVAIGRDLMGLVMEVEFEKTVFPARGANPGASFL